MQTVQKNEPYLHFLRFNGVFYAILLSKISTATFFLQKIYTIQESRQLVKIQFVKSVKTPQQLL